MHAHSDMLPCPACGQATDSLKAYRLPTFLLFIFVGASFRHGTIIACPPCMRAKLGKLALINILPANLLWLVLLLPWYGIAALRSFTKGHSNMAHSLGEAVPEERYRSAAGKDAIAALASTDDWHEEPALKGYFSPETPDEIDAHFVLPHHGTTERLRVRMLRRDGLCYRAQLVAGSPKEPGLHQGLEVFVRPSMSHPPLVWVPPAASTNLEQWTARCDQCQFELCFTPALELARRTNPAAQLGYEPSPMHDACAACGGRLVVERAAARHFGVPHPSDEEQNFAAGLGETADKLWLAAFGAASLFSLIGVGVAGYNSESAGVDAALAAAIPLGATLGGWRGLHWARRNGRPAWTTGIAALIGGAFLFGAAVFFFFGIFPAL